MTGPQFAAIISWLLLIEGLALLSYPFLRPLNRALPDKGWLLAKPAGLLLVGYPAWLIGNLVPGAYSRAGLTVVLALIALTSAGFFWRQRTQLVDERPKGIAQIAVGEMLFIGVFLGFLVLRLFDPELWNPVSGGEKPMDLALLNACLRSGELPPPDPWLSGHIVNYYYFGHLLFGIPAKLLGLGGEYAYNLALPTVAAFTAAAAYSVVGVFQGIHRERPSNQNPVSTKTTRPWLWAGLGPLFVMLIGNLFEARLLLSGLRTMGADSGFDGIPLVGPAFSIASGFARLIGGTAAWPYEISSLYWSATRLLPAQGQEIPPITEFPYFSLLYGDLHPHLMGLPFTLLFTGLLLAAVLRDERNPKLRAAELIWTTFSLAGVLLVHPWNFPASAALLVLALWVREKRLSGGRPGRFRRVFIHAASVVASALVLSGPFFIHYAPPVGPPKLWLGTQTPLREFGDLFGLFLFVILAGGLLRLSTGNLFRRPSTRGIAVAAAVILGALALLFEAVDFPLSSTVTLLLLGLGAMSVSALISRPDRETGMIWCLVIAGSLCALVSEILTMGPGVDRMNTVFKFYYQVWFYWALAAAALLPRVFESFRSFSGRWPRIGFASIFAVLLSASCLYPPFSTYAKIAGRWSDAAPTLDGTRYMEEAVFRHEGRDVPLRPDLEAIQWLKRHAPGTAVLVEAAGPDYSWAGRISANTGIPTLIGWPAHVRQHHPGVSLREIRERQEAIRTIYEARDVESAIARTRQFGIDYIYVGPLERAAYDAAGLQKFEETVSGAWETAMAGPGFRIVRVIEAGTPGTAGPGVARSAAHSRPGGK